MTVELNQNSPQHDQRHRNPILVVVTSFAVATGAGLLVGRLVQPPALEIVRVGVIWVAFYPVARLNPRAPWWAHWARGAAMLIGVVLALHFFR